MWKLKKEEGQCKQTGEGCEGEVRGGDSDEGMEERKWDGVESRR